jgi:glycosyltransferase involved in cell wall biosynthesis
MDISVVILTFNSEQSIAETICSAHQISCDIHVVDSFSNDATCDIARQLGASVVQHPFLNYSAQRNWAIDNLPLRYKWELHLDADEWLSQELVTELKQLSFSQQTAASGYHIARLVRFLGRPIRHGGMFPIWHMRLFRSGAGRCERREYDQHFVVNGPTGKLRGWLVDDYRSPLSEWIQRHNKWSDAEVRELTSDPTGRLLIEPSLFGSPLQRKRYFRQAYQRLPAFARAFVLFGYRYFLRLGFLDGKEGLIFFVLQTFWYRFLVDAKLLERQLLSNAPRDNPRSVGDMYTGCGPESLGRAAESALAHKR